MLLVSDRIPLSVIKSSANVIDSEMAKIINADLKKPTLWEKGRAQNKTQ